MIDDLVYDVGMNNGDDTAYYLARGYRVVSIEADPMFIDEARQKFAPQISSGALKLLNCAVGAENGTAPFWISPQARVWNSFNKECAGRLGLPHHAIDVPVRRFKDILAEFGVPLYLKIDIEGHDHFCLADIDPADRPRHVSWELNGVADLFAVSASGYNAFKCVSQSTFATHSPGRIRGASGNPSGRGLRGTVTDAIKQIPVVGPLAQAAKRSLKADARHGEPSPTRIVSHVEWPGGAWSFPFGSSGPFGPDLGGDWKTPEEVAYDYMDYWLYRGRHTPIEQRDWFDAHATTLPSGEAPQIDWSFG